MRRHRDERYHRAVGRQQLLCDRGYYTRPESALGFEWHCDPAPAEQLMRPDDARMHDAHPTDPRIDFRSYAREATQ